MSSSINKKIAVQTAKNIKLIILCCISVINGCAAENDITMWPEYRGPHGTYQTSSALYPPLEFSVTTGRNIKWRFALEQPGHSGVTVWGDKLFFTCFRPLTINDNINNITSASETIGFCLNAQTGTLLWTHPLPGKRPNQVNCTFTDATTPSPVTDGKHVWFINAGGFMACLTMDGKLVWEKEFEVRTKHSAKQFQPFVYDGCLYYVMMRDKSDPKRIVQTAKDYDKNSKTGWPWMFVRRFDGLTGEDRGLLEQGITVHCKGIRGTLNNQPVLLTTRGGSHSPPEKPDGMSLTSLSPFGDIIWDKPNKFVHTTDTMDDRHIYAFEKGKLTIYDLKTGDEIKEIEMFGDLKTYRSYDEKQGNYVDSDALPKPANVATERTAIPCGSYVYFMHYAPGIVGRVNIETGKSEYVQVPLQIAYDDKGQKVSRYSSFEGTSQTGAGFEIIGDKRIKGNGFGHVSAATPIIVNDRIYFSTMLGTVYVIDAKAPIFNEHAVLAVNDLGQAGSCWTLAPFSFAAGNLYQHTMREIVCIGEQ